MNDSHQIPQHIPEASTESLVKAYEEICKSYHSIDEFRTRLLGLLPLSSLVGIFLLDPAKMISATAMPLNELFGFASLFAACSRWLCLATKYGACDALIRLSLRVFIWSNNWELCMVSSIYALNKTATTIWTIISS